VILRQIYDIGIGASVGLAQARAGETGVEVVARADMDLYRQKKARMVGGPGQKSPLRGVSSPALADDNDTPALSAASD
jgi:hypothetical protein